MFTIPDSINKYNLKYKDEKTKQMLTKIATLETILQEVALHIEEYNSYLELRVVLMKILLYHLMYIMKESVLIVKVGLFVGFMRDLQEIYQKDLSMEDIYKIKMQFIM